MSSCPLLALPRELRDQIYTQLYPPSSNHTTLLILGHSTRYRLANFSLQSHTGHDSTAYTTAFQNATSLHRTCRQLRHEASPFFEESMTYKIVVEGSSPGPIGSRLSEGAFRSLVQRMRRVVLLLTWKYRPYSDSTAASENPRLSDVEQVLSPLKRNLAVLAGMLRGREGLRVEAVGLDFDARRASGGGGVVDSAVAVLERLGRQEVIKIRNLSQPREAVSEKSMARLVKVLGGVDCTEPLPVENEADCGVPGSDPGRWARVIGDPRTFVSFVQRGMEGMALGP